LLDSLAREGVAADRILVVHNPSAPGQQPPAIGLDCEQIGNDRNLGYAAAMNVGIAHQLDRGCELLLVLTHDARLRSGALRAMLEAAERSPEYGAIGPVLVHAGTDTPFSFGGITRAGGGVRHRKAEPPAPGGVAPCDWIDGGTMLIRAEALARVGSFDERFWGYWEDADLCLRITRAGHRIGVAVSALADQAPGGSKRPGPWAYLLTRNGIAYAKRFAGIRGLLSATSGALWQTLVELARTVARATPLRPGAPADTWAVANGTLRGILDFYAGQWGPPPRGLPGMGDLRNLDPPYGPEAPDAG
jgi:GT2 family glycosyltransferase